MASWSVPGLFKYVNFSFPFLVPSARTFILASHKNVKGGVMVANAVLSFPFSFPLVPSVTRAVSVAGLWAGDVFEKLKGFSRASPLSSCSPHCAVSPLCAWVRRQRRG